MPQLPRNKEQIGIYISKQVLYEFKKYVKGKYGNMYGLSTECEKAIALYLLKYRNSINFDNNDKELKIVKNKVWELKQQLRNYLSKEQRIDVNEIQYVKFQDFKKAIQALRGSDKRTINNHIKTLQENDCIKIIDVKDGKIVDIS